MIASNGLSRFKTINEAVVGKEAQERLWREARALARVTHPNICQIFDVLEEGESLVLILELLDGQSLAERLRCGVIPSSEALGIERQILRALQALHDLGIVHRDLKPSNVFSTRYGIKLLDFGLARRTEGWFADDPNQTTTGAALTAPGMIVEPHHICRRSRPAVCRRRGGRHFFRRHHLL